jgi:hypothetical protein
MAINKPNNYEETPTGGDFTPVELGGHYLVIKQVSERKSAKGNDMIVVLFDFDVNDKQPGYFMEQFKNDIRPEKKYPNQGTAYIVTDDADGNCSRSFKTFTTCIEHSNPNFQIQWGDKFCECLKGKKIGGVFGIVEEEYEGDVKKKRKLRWFTSVDKVKDAAVPDEKLLNRQQSSLPTPDSSGFVNIPDGIDDELPFN